MYVTIVNLGYFPQLYAWASALRRLIRSEMIVVCLIDREVEPSVILKLESSLMCRIVRPREFLSDENIEDLTSRYDLVEYATAIKPHLLSYLLHSSPTVTYLDPDTYVLSLPKRQSNSFSFSVTPHRVTPCAPDSVLEIEHKFLRYGAFNLGYIEVTENSNSFLEWWKLNTYFFCYRVPGDYYFTDQKFIDLAPAFFNVNIIKDLTYNVATWNLDERKLEEIDENYFVNGRSLIFVHFAQIHSKFLDVDFTAKKDLKLLGSNASNEVFISLIEQYRILMLEGFEFASLNGLKVNKTDRRYFHSDRSLGLSRFTASLGKSQNKNYEFRLFLSRYLRAPRVIKRFETFSYLKLGFYSDFRRLMNKFARK